MKVGVYIISMKPEGFPSPNGPSTPLLQQCRSTVVPFKHDGPGIELKTIPIALEQTNDVRIES